MKKYYLLIFLSGDYKDSISQSQRAEYMEGHLGNISKMAQEGYVDIAGPLDGTSDKRGILVFNTESIEQIDLLMKNDPLVANERLKYEVHPWWAAKGSCLK